MKKLLVVLLAVCMLFAFAACANEPATDENPADEQQQEDTVTPEDAVTPEETPEYEGEYTNENGDTVSLTKNEDGSYDVTIGITRLTTFEGTGNIMDGAVEFVVSDPNGGEVDGIFYPAEDGETYEVNFTVSTWELLEEGTVFEGFTAAE